MSVYITILIRSPISLFFNMLMWYLLWILKNFYMLRAVMPVSTPFIMFKQIYPTISLRLLLNTYQESH